MGLKIGTQSVAATLLGSTAVAAMFLGSSEVALGGGVTPPPEYAFSIPTAGAATPAMPTGRGRTSTAPLQTPAAAGYSVSAGYWSITASGTYSNLDLSNMSIDIRAPNVVISQCWSNGFPAPGGWRHITNSADGTGPKHSFRVEHTTFDGTGTPGTGASPVIIGQHEPFDVVSCVFRGINSDAADGCVRLFKDNNYYESGLDSGAHQDVIQLTNLRSDCRIVGNWCDIDMSVGGVAANAILKAWPGDYLTATLGYEASYEGWQIMVERNVFTGTHDGPDMPWFMFPTPSESGGPHVIQDNWISSRDGGAPWNRGADPQWKGNWYLPPNWSAINNVATMDLTLYDDALPTPDTIDNFNRADAALDAGSSWSRLDGSTGAGGVRSNQMAVLNTTSTHYVVPDCGSRNQYVEFKAVSSTSIAPASYVMMRYNEVGTYIGVRCDRRTGLQQVQLFKCINGTFTSLGATSMTINATDLIRAECVDDTARVLVNGTQVIAPVNVSGLTGEATRAGIHCRTTVMNPFIDDFKHGFILSP